MDKEIKEKLEALKRIIPNRENEAMIRNLCQILLGEAKSLKANGENNESAKKLENGCYDILNALERSKIINSPANEFKPFYKYDLPLLIKNAVCASDIMLCAPYLTLTNKSYSPFYCSCSERLITRAVCEEALYFFKYYKSGTVIFSASRGSSYSLLSAEIKTDNQIGIINDENTFSLLEKTAQIHGGTFLIKQTVSSAGLYLTIKNTPCDEAKYRRIPSYIDLLSDRTSSVFIILSSSR